MQRFLFFLGVWIAGTALAAPAFAQSDVAIRAVRATGSGCNRDSVAVVVQGREASVTFSNYRIESTGGPGGPSMRNCNVSIMLDIPDGVTLAATRVVWIGTVALEPGGSAQFLRRFVFGGMPQVNVTRGFASGFEQFVLDDPLASARASGCNANGRQLNLLAATSLGLTGPGTISVDSSDIGGPAMRILFERGTCQAATTPPGRGPAARP
jgi:hypothetical protein